VLINGLDARVTYAFAADNSPGWMDAPSRQTPSAQVLRRGGARVLDKPRDQARQLTLRGTIMGASASDARDKADALKAALCRNSGVQLTFDDEPTRYVLARCEAFRVPPTGPSLIQNRLTVEATMTAHDPFAYDLDDVAMMAWYDVGDTLPGETFSASTARNYFDVNGVLQTAAANKKRDAAYMAGVRTHLLEKLATNIVLFPRDLTNGAWVKTGITPTKDQVGLDGTANSATRLLATAPNGTCLQAVVLASSLRAQEAWIRRNSGVGIVEMTMDNGVTWTSLGTPPAGGPFVKVTIPNQTLANPTIGFRLPTSGSEVIVDFVQNELGPDSTSPYAFGGSRTTEVYTAPWPFAPNVPLTLYLKYIEQSIDTVSQRRLLAIGTTEPQPEFLLYATTTMNFYHHNGTTAVSSAAALSTVAGDLVELRAVVYPDGHVIIAASKNGGAEVVGAASAGQAFAGAWTVPQIRFGVSAHVMGLIAFRAMRGEQSLAVIRAATKPQKLISDAITNVLPLGTGPSRPVLTITGVAVNPSIALYNSLGVLVGTMTLTVTTVAADILVIDNDAKTIKLNGANRLDLLTSGDFFTIDPSDANFDGVGPTFTTSSGALGVSYRRSWR
jgi:predicted phage tail component-like protein